MAIDIAPDRKAEDIAHRMSVPQLRQRNAELRGPAERVDLGRDLPNTVPRIVFLLIVTVHRIVALDASGVYRELEAGAAVVVGIYDDLDMVTADAEVAAGQELLDTVGMRVKGSHENVEIAVVVGDPGFGREARVRILGRLELPEVLDDGRQAPDRVVILPIDHRRGRSAVRHSSRGVGRRRVRWRGIGRLQSEYGGDDGREEYHHSFDGTIRQMVGFVVGSPVRQTRVFP